jgi:STAM-binding protein
MTAGRLRRALLLTLALQADIYEREGDDQQAYFLFFRHAHLVLTHLVVHPDARKPLARASLAEAQGEVKKNLERLDILRPRINNKYDEYVKHKREAEARRAVVQAERRESYAPPPYDVLEHYSGQHLEASQNSELAIQIAQKEISRRAASRSVRDDDEDLSQRIQRVAAQAERHRLTVGVGTSAVSREEHPSQAIGGFKYPTVPINRDRLPPESPITSPPLKEAQLPDRIDSTIAPLLPPKPQRSDVDSPPPRPEKVTGTSSAGISTPPQAYTFAPAAYLENGTPLRTLFLPPTLRTTFLRVAHNNTIANLETCAFLAGTLISNALFVSKLIVPAQTSTSDTCEMTNESQLFDYVDSEADLMILGWIHTHPTQTCFMSSRDLHTHAGYQMMLAESVAVVCAPSKGDTLHGGEWGVYRLTDPPGKRAILACEKPGIFHPHDVDNIYTDALRPGHVVEAKGLDFELVDLRNGDAGT